jgi:hypothetical protein
MLRRLEDRIRDLCAKAVIAGEPELGGLLSELKAALHEHAERLRRLAATKLTAATGGQQQERRTLQ